MSERGLSMPAGFRFHPTDQEVTMSYLLPKSLNPSFDPLAMGEVNLNKCEPWDLPKKAKIGEEEWYFFCRKDMRYRTGRRAKRATAKGYWKATGRDREIFEVVEPAPPAAASSSASASAGRRELVGMRKTLVFYMGRAPKGTKTDWVMHEFRLEGKYRNDNATSPKDEWVVCKVFHKNNDGEDKKYAGAGADETSAAGTPDNVSAIPVDAAGATEDVEDPMSYFDFLPDLTTIDDDAGQQYPLESYDLHDQAMVSSRAPGDVISPSFADASAGLPSSSATGISQHDDSQGRRSYHSYN